MQENRSFDIFKRFIYLVLAIIFWHIVTRVMCATVVVIGINIGNFLSYYSEDVPQPDWWMNVWNYTNDWGWIIISHIVGAGVAYVLYLVIFDGARNLFNLVVYGRVADEGVHCENSSCSCVYHKAQSFTEGRWRKNVCRDANCPCKKYHVNQVFKPKKQKWVYVG